MINPSIAIDVIQCKFSNSGKNKLFAAIFERRDPDSQGDYWLEAHPLIESVILTKKARTRSHKYASHDWYRNS